MNTQTFRSIRRHLLIYAGLTPFLVIALFPIFWMAITAFKQDADLYRMDQVPIFLTYLVPGIILFIPLARVVGTLGLFDSWWALVVVYPSFTIPFCTWKMVGYFKAVPREIEEAAWVDGCGLLGTVLRVVVPLSRQGVIITALFAFSLAMQEFLYAVVYVAPRSEQVVTVGLATALIRGDIYFWGSLMAGGLIVGVPIAVLYAFVLDHFIQGLIGVSS